MSNKEFPIRHEYRKFCLIAMELPTRTTSGWNNSPSIPLIKSIGSPNIQLRPLSEMLHDAA